MWAWVDQVEIWFPILQRRVLKHGDFASAATMTHNVLRVIAIGTIAEPIRPLAFRGRFMHHPFAA